MSTRLPGAARRMITATTVNALGNGLVLPFAVILLHEVRGFSLPTTGLVLAVPGVVGLAVVPLSGILVDRLGARRVLRTALVLQALGSLLLGRAETVPTAVLGVVLLGLGIGPSFPASAALLSGLVQGPDQTSRAFGMQFTLLNAGIGAATLVAGLVADVDRAWTFVALYTANSVLTLVAATIVPPGRPRAEPEQAGSGGTYREVLSDRAFRLVCVVALMLALSGYAALDSGFPAFARVVGGVEPRWIALAFTANTVLIVAAQPLVLRLLRGRRRTTAIAGAGAVWGLSWAWLGTLMVGGHETTIVLTFGAFFAAGEVLMAPALAPLTNALAPDHLRGRYNALQSSMFSVSFVVAPALSGLLIGLGLHHVWLASLVVAAAGVVVACTALRRRLTDEQDGIAPRDAPTDAAETMAV